MTQEEKKEAMEMYDAGFMQKAIAKKLNVSPHTIYTHISKQLTLRIEFTRGIINIISPCLVPTDGFSRAYFFPEQRGNDGIEGYLCGEIMKSRKKLNELYDTHSKLRYGNNPAKEVLLKLVNEQITDLENQLEL